MINRQLRNTKHLLVCTKSPNTKMRSNEKKSKPKINEDNDSDGAPEEVTFKEGLDKMLEMKRNITKKAEEEKEKLKQKRKRQEEMFIEQKKQKLAKLESMKLPEEFLEKIEDEPLKGKPSKISEKSNNIKPIEIPNENIDNDVEMADDEEDNEDETFDSEEEKNIPEKITGIIAVHNVPTSKVTPAFEKARDFKNNALFGPAANRQSMKSFLGVREKRRFRK